MASSSGRSIGGSVEQMVRTSVSVSAFPEAFKPYRRRDAAIAAPSLCLRCRCGRFRPIVRGRPAPIVAVMPTPRLTQLPGEARLRAHQRAGGRRGGRRRQPLRRAQAPRDRRPLRPAARARRRAEELGGAEGAVARPGRQAAGGRDRGPSARVHRLRGRDPRGRVRRRADDRLGHRRLGADGRRGRRASAKGDFKFRLAGEKLRGGWMLARLKPKPGEKKTQLAALQGARPGRRPGDRHPRGAAGEREVRAAIEELVGAAAGARRRRRRLRPGRAPRRGEGGAAPTRIAPQLATPGRRAAARGDGLAARDQARRLPHDRPSSTGDEVRLITRAGLDWTAPLRRPAGRVPGAALPARR